MAFSHLIGAFSLIVTQFQQISSYAVVMARLSALGEGVERLETVAARIEMDSGEELEYRQLSLRSPRDGRLLVANLSARLPVGTRTLVTGDEEASIALFRATAGLWEAGEGRIVLPPADEILFLTERPYLPPGTLRQALVRTGREQDLTDARIHEVLRELGVAGMLEKAGGLDVERDWDELLSLGEQQVLSFARLALAAPRYALLDRPKTVLGLEAVARALDFLADQAVTLVTFANESFAPFPGWRSRSGAPGELPIFGHPGPGSAPGVERRRGPWNRPSSLRSRQSSARRSADQPRSRPLG
jgi:putative ATP-binding cassette transporter